NTAAGLVALMIAGPAGAGPVTDWLIATGAEPREIRHVARYTPEEPAILGADPLTYYPGFPPFEFAAVSAGAADVVALIEPVEGRVALAALIFADAEPLCGDEVGVIWVDTGTAAFLTPPVAAKLAAMADEYHASARNLYTDYFAAAHQMGDSVFARMLTLPDGTAFPGFSSGWGDGAYPVVRLFDADQRVIALYADFIGSDALDDFILPAPCDPEPAA
ncbi:MAG: DUF4241 domain-containing protein, partial [Paracoccus sp. (in: a-proteobacteria)]|nr:DUF4241 domain-containing protein [Paracoccus sp. (in: a-proteobacteria)]